MAGVMRSGDSAQAVKGLEGWVGWKGEKGWKGVASGRAAKDVRAGEVARVMHSQVGVRAHERC